MTNETPRAREQRTVFGEVAELYDRARPAYPDALVQDVLDFVGKISPRILEVGAGTGKATVLFAQRDLEIVALEPSTEMAAVLHRHGDGFPGVTFAVSTFEDWVLEPAAFDLVISAQAWHWVAPDVGYVKAHAALAPRGTLALFWNRPQWDNSALRAALDDCVPATRSRPQGTGAGLSGPDRTTGRRGTGTGDRSFGILRIRYATLIPLGEAVHDPGVPRATQLPI